MKTLPRCPKCDAKIVLAGNSWSLKPSVSWTPIYVCLGLQKHVLTREELFPTPAPIEQVMQSTLFEEPTQ